MNRLDKNAFHQRLGEFMIQTKTFSNVKVRFLKKCRENLSIFQSPFEFMTEEDYTCGIQSRMALLSQPDGDFDAIKMKTLFDLTFKVETLYDSISTSTSLQALTLTDEEG